MLRPCSLSRYIEYCAGLEAKVFSADIVHIIKENSLYYETEQAESAQQKRCDTLQAYRKTTGLLCLTLLNSALLDLPIPDRIQRD